jgi:hypothetical protein
MAQTISGISGVHLAEFNSTTGSLLIIYSEKLLKGIAPLTAALAVAGLPLDIVDLTERTEHDVAIDEYSAATKAIGSLLRDIELTVKYSTNNQFDLKVLLPIGTAIAAGVYAMSNGSVPTPLWLTLAMFTLTSFIALNQLDTRMVTAPARVPSADNG